MVIPSDNLKACGREWGTHSLIDISKLRSLDSQMKVLLSVLKAFGRIPNILAMSFFGESPFCTLRIIHTLSPEL